MQLCQLGVASDLNADFLLSHVQSTFSLHLPFSPPSRSKHWSYGTCYRSYGTLINRLPWSVHSAASLGRCAIRARVISPLTVNISLHHFRGKKQGEIKTRLIPQGPRGKKNEWFPLSGRCLRKTQLRACCACLRSFLISSIVAPRALQSFSTDRFIALMTGTWA